MKRPFYITTPIYYVNDKPHIGHSYTTIAADLIARYHRLAGRDVFFLTGTDEHGTKIAEAAAAAGLSPQEFCDKTSQYFRNTWKSLGIQESDFIRTTDARHIKGVGKVLEALKGATAPDGQPVIYESVYEGLYCTGCEKFLTEKDLVDGKCPYHPQPPVKLTEKNWFFRLRAFMPEIKRRILANELVILPLERRSEVLGLIEQDLPDFSVSREKVTWGIPLSFDPSQFAYVWVDALSNYITALGYADNPASFQKWWVDAESVHLMAKDILKFHCLYWPAMLLAAGLKLPETIFIHGFFTVDGEKMSKSLGNMIDPNEMVAKYGADGTRYLLLTQYPFGADGDIQVSRFTQKYNSDLANDLGNLVSRVVKMIERHFGGKLPAPCDGLPGQQELLELSEDAPGRVYTDIRHFRLQSAIESAMALVAAANKFFDTNAPWSLQKQGKTAEFGGVLYTCAEILGVVSVLLYPVMPEKMRELRVILGLKDDALALDKAREFYNLAPGSSVAMGDALFPRIIGDFVPGGTAMTNASSETASATLTQISEEGLIDISQFGKMKLVVADVLAAERVKGADKLLKLQISLGEENRQIVAGVAEFYTPEEMVGRKIVVVANLKPATIRGIESNGMLLAAKKGKALHLVSPSGDIPAGATVG